MSRWTEADIPDQTGRIAIVTGAGIVALVLGHTGVGAALILVLLAQWIVLTFFQKPMEEVDPRMFLSWPDWLLGGP